MSPQVPAGWYPDPTDPSRVRWWDGSYWGQQAAPAGAAAPPVDAAPTVPAPAEQAPTYATPAPSYATPTPSAAPAVTPWPTAAPPVARSGPSAPGVATDTIWIYLAIIAGTLPMFTIFLMDWDGYIDVMVEMSGRPSSAAASAMMTWVGGILLITLLSYAFLGLSVLFAWFDWRELRKRGIDKPFHWAFAFFALVVTIGVYVIGRTVVVKRETGKGLTPLWVWIAATVLGFVVISVWSITFTQQLLERIPVN
ncbi:DUF2510 domain-containing protein [uncultured Microbacterium sp.]|uniref:DUF2510 domain-containing protein n=1 Tax=uncultured Microbacterium sp. TaxID=191216 RepID=A0A1Y5P175_9MICO|nr:DUF2510 domain-containing protein [uncultured Microbacterium sp.]SBS69831.1 conserved membrane hypothetical protein [uncultured Microbacterium sp.]